ncbi:unnamed protein product, partial [Rotaria sp. Silwood1]
MYISRWRHSRRYLYIGVSLLFFLTLFIHFQYFTQRLDFDDKKSQQSTYCDQTIIRKHFMNDQ